MRFTQLRIEYHKQLCENILAISSGVPNIADKGNRASIEISKLILGLVGYSGNNDTPSGQRAGSQFEAITRDYLEQCFTLINHLRPGKFRFSLNTPISHFEQYEHLQILSQLLKTNTTLATALGTDYLITPDIIIAREPISDDEVNIHDTLVSQDRAISNLTPLLRENRPGSTLLLHASISCKWTIRSDRAQNIRTEALNLIRNRKGHSPHAVAVTAEPLPTRLASLALGTGDLDCVYHFALYELRKALNIIGNVDQLDMLNNMIEGRRLRDISDLPFDLAI